MSVKAQTVEDLTFTNEQNQQVDLSELAKNHRAVVLVFTSSHCSWAVKYQERLNELAREFAPKDIAFVAVNSNDPTMSQTDALARMSALSPYEFPYVKDKDQSAAQMLEANKNPEAFVLTPMSTRSVDNDPVFKVVYRGKIDDNPLEASLVKEAYLKDAIEQILSGGDPQPQNTTANGCNIKWIR